MNKLFTFIRRLLYLAVLCALALVIGYYWGLDTGHEEANNIYQDRLRGLITRVQHLEFELGIPPLIEQDTAITRLTEKIFD